MRRRKPISTIALIAELLRAVDKSNTALLPAERLTAAVDAEDIHSDLGLRLTDKRREVQSGGVSGRIAEVTAQKEG